jgi:hypothetical protein
MERRGRKEYIQILRLLENFSIAQVEAAIKQAFGIGALSFADYLPRFKGVCVKYS